MCNTITSSELAAILGLSPNTIHSALVRRPDRLPPPIRIPGSNRLIWRRKDVDTWIDAFQSQPANPIRGRPLKVAVEAGGRS